MSKLSGLLLQLEALHRQRFMIDERIDRLKREITGAHKTEPKRRKRPTAAETAQLVQGVVKLLRDAGEALPGREIAARLGLSPSAVYYRLQKALEAKFIERVSGGRYRASSVILQIVPPASQ